MIALEKKATFSFFILVFSLVPLRIKMAWFSPIDNLIIILSQFGSNLIIFLIPNFFSILFIFNYIFMANIKLLALCNSFFDIIRLIKLLLYKSTFMLIIRLLLFFIHKWNLQLLVLFITCFLFFCDNCIGFWIFFLVHILPIEILEWFKFFF